MTWNVGEVYWPWNGNQLKDADVEVVARVVAALDPDIVLLQELLDERQLRTIAGRGYASQLAQACGYDRHVGVLVKSRHEPRFSDHLLSPTTRGVVEAQLTLDGLEMRAFSLHFDVFNRPRRLAQVHCAAAIIGGGSSQLTIAGGDFNYDPVASARLGYTEDLESEAALGVHLSDVATDSGPTLVGLLRVDRLLARGDMIASTRSFTSTERTPLGDHAPLVCDLALRSPGSARPPIRPSRIRR
ncbi:MAG: endonuclease/exonuclease/phosphatase family protein [Polyangia bacterium]